MRVSFFEKLQECNNGHKRNKSVKFVKIIMTARANTTLTLYFLLTLWWTHVGLPFINIRIKQTLVTHSFLYHYTEEPQHSRDSRLSASQSHIWKISS